MEVCGVWNGEMEVSVMELYYNVKFCFCEYQKTRVSRQVARRIFLKKRRKIMKAFKKYIIDFTEVNYYLEMHAVIWHAFEFPDY